MSKKALVHKIKNKYIHTKNKYEYNRILSIINSHGINYNNDLYNLNTNNTYIKLVGDSKIGFYIQHGGINNISGKYRELIISSDEVDDSYKKGD